MTDASPYRQLFVLVFALVATFTLPHLQSAAYGQDEVPIVYRVPKQPLLAATNRLVQAMEFAGAPLSAQVNAALESAAKLPKDADVSLAIQQALDPLCLATVHINAESRVKVGEGPVAKQLMQQGWRAFLVKVHNEAGITPELVVDSPNAAPVYQRGQGARQKPRTDEDLVDLDQSERRWLDLSMLTRQPLKKRLSGLNLEYRVVMLGSRDA
ncbi:MAG: hypothetical protein KDB00_15950, partial [Planctomycetales bacterium]|nr:hypothetical protein [Planctomycetales bacterium]